MSQLFRLFWLRENGCDAGTPFRAAELEVEIRQRVVDLAAISPSARSGGEIDVRLPYMDAAEWRKRGKILEGLDIRRDGDVISVVLSAADALRDMAATLVFTDPVWLAAPGLKNPNHFPVWQQVSLGLQSSFRAWIPEIYFQDITRFEDRERAFPMLVYQAAHLCRGRSRGEFAYSFNDYPDCRLTLAWALKMTGLAMQKILGGVERRLNQAGMVELARRYAPVWYQDVVVAVRKKPKMFLDVLQAESQFIDAVIDLSLNRTAVGVNAFARAANLALRKVYGASGQGMDLRYLGTRALEQATESLEASGVAQIA